VAGERLARNTAEVVLPFLVNGPQGDQPGPCQFVQQVVKGAPGQLLTSLREKRQGVVVQMLDPALVESLDLHRYDPVKTVVNVPAATVATIGLDELAQVVVAETRDQLLDFLGLAHPALPDRIQHEPDTRIQ